MATVAATPTTPTSALAITTEVKAFYRVVFKKVNEKGEEVIEFDIVNEKAGKKAEEELKYDGKEVISVEHQDFVEYFANTLAGAQELISDEGEFVAMFNRGISTKQDNRARQWLKQSENDTWTNAVTEAAYDMKEDLKTPTSRRLSPQEKLLENVQSVMLTPEMFAQLDAILAARKASLGIK